MPMYFSLDGRDQLVLAGLLAKLPTVEESDCFHRIMRRLYVRYSPNFQVNKHGCPSDPIGHLMMSLKNSFEFCCEKQKSTCGAVTKRHAE